MEGTDGFIDGADWAAAAEELEARAERRLSGAMEEGDHEPLVSPALRGTEFEALLHAADAEAAQAVQKRISLSDAGVEAAAADGTNTATATAGPQDDGSTSAGEADDDVFTADAEVVLGDGDWEEAQRELEDRAVRRLSGSAVDTIVTEADTLIVGTEFDALLNDADREATETVRRRMSTEPVAPTEAAPQPAAEEPDTAPVEATESPPQTAAEALDTQAAASFVASSKEELAELRTMVTGQTAAANSLLADVMGKFSAAVGDLSAKARRGEESAAAIEGYEAQVEELNRQAWRIAEERDQATAQARGLEAELQQSRQATTEEQAKLEELLGVNDDLVAQLKGLQAGHDAELTAARDQAGALSTSLEEARGKCAKLEGDTAELKAELEMERREAEATTDRLRADLDKLKSEWEQADKAAASQTALAEEFNGRLSDTQLQVATLKERCAQMAKDAEVQQAAHGDETTALLGRVEDAAARAQGLEQELASERTRNAALQNEIARVEGNLKTLLGGNTADPRAEIIRLRMEQRVHETELNRFQAQELDLRAQLQGLHAALAETSLKARKVEDAEEASAGMHKQSMVSHHMVKILEEENRDLRGRIAREVAARAEAQNGHASMKIDLEYANKRLKDLEQQSAYNASSAFGATAPKFDYSSASTTSYMEAYRASLYSTPSFGMGAAGDGSGGGLSGMDYMQDARLAEQRAKEAERREEVLLARIKAMELEAQSVKHAGESMGMVSGDVHRRLMDQLTEQLRDQTTRTRELETEALSLRAQARAMMIGEIVTEDSPVVLEVLGLLTQLEERLKQRRKGPASKPPRRAPAVEEPATLSKTIRARTERSTAFLSSAKKTARPQAHKAKDAATSPRRHAPRDAAGTPPPPTVRNKRESKKPGPAREAQPSPPAVVVAKEAKEAKEPRVRATGLDLPDLKSSPAPTTARPQPPSPSPRRGGKVAALAQKLSQSPAEAIAKESTTPRASPAPRRLNSNLLRKLDRSFVAQAGGDPADVLKHVRDAKQHHAQTASTGSSDDDDWSDSSEEEAGNGSASAPPPGPLPAEGEGRPLPSISVDSMTGAELIRPPSLTAQFSRPKNRSKRLPSRRRSTPTVAAGTATAQDEEDTTAKPASGATEAVVKPTQAEPPTAATTSQSGLPMASHMRRRRADSHSEEEENEDDWGDEDEGAGESAAAAAAPADAPALTDKPKTAPDPAPAPQPKPQAAASPPQRTPKVSPHPKSKPPVSSKKKKPAPAVAAKAATAPKPKPVPSKAKAKPAKKPVAKAVATPQVKKAEEPAAPATKPAAAAAVKQVKAIDLFKADDDDDDMFSARRKKKSTKARKSLFDDDGDANDDWLS